MKTLHLAPLLAATVVILVATPACKPKVLLFTATPKEISRGDSVHLEWKTRGSARMTVHETLLYRPPDTLPAMEFLLTATKWGKTSAAVPQQVTLRPATSRDEVILQLDSLAGDSLIYRANKDSSYRGFRLLTLQTTLAGTVMIMHAANQTVVTTSGQATEAMQGLPYDGPWEARIKMTPQQQQDRHTRPGKLVLITTITRKN